MSKASMTNALAGVLADTYVLQVKTQNYHWNVVGPYFPALHALFENQYNELFAAVDEIAERLRQLGEHAPGTMAEFLRLTVISEQSANSAAGMVADLAASNAKLIDRIHGCLHIADDEDDESTEDLMIRRLNAHQKAEWMLRATLGDEATPATPTVQPKQTASKSAASAQKKTEKPAKKEKAKPSPSPKPAPAVKTAKSVSGKENKKKGKVALG